MPSIKQKKIAAINDFSGFGRCSLTVSIPIISAAGIQCCPLPTAILSNHTGYSDYYFDDYTDRMKPYYNKWEKLGLRFDAIYSGFLGSERQIVIVTDFIERFSDRDTIIIIDPVMGDNGRMYATLTGELCRSLKKLTAHADILTPNVTEACILTETPYIADPDAEMINAIADKLLSFGCKNAVITGIMKGDSIGNYICRSSGERIWVTSPLLGSSRAGTGDVFASVLAADAVNGMPLEDSVRRAADFVSRAILLSDDQELPSQDGLCFEPLLGELVTNKYRALQHDGDNQH